MDDERQLQDNDYEYAMKRAEMFLVRDSGMRAPTTEEVVALRFLLALDTPNPYTKPYVNKEDIWNV